MYNFIMSYKINTSQIQREISVKSESISGAIKKLFSLYDDNVNITKVEVIKIIEL